MWDWGEWDLEWDRGEWEQEWDWCDLGHEWDWGEWDKDGINCTVYAAWKSLFKKKKLTDHIKNIHQARKECDVCLKNVCFQTNS